MENPRLGRLVTDVARRIVAYQRLDDSIRIATNGATPFRGDPYEPRERASRILFHICFVRVRLGKKRKLVGVGACEKPR